MKKIEDPPSDNLPDDHTRIVVIPPILKSQIVAVVGDSNPMQRHYLHLESGKLEALLNDQNDLPPFEEDLEDELFTEAFLELDADNYRLVPTMMTHESYQMMVDFAATIDDTHLHELLVVALNGKGAFRRFKDVLISYPTYREKWFKFEEVNQWRFFVDHFASLSIVIVLGDQATDEEI
ncbi:MAG: UPF0158 family protein [Promethearchaeota archaeon]